MPARRRNRYPQQKIAVLFVLIVYTVWGLQPLYWQLFGPIPLSHILAHRIIWSAILLVPTVLLAKRRIQLTRVPVTAKLTGIVFMCALAIGGNWLLNIYAAATKQVVEASLGHYITPIVVILLGVFVLKEPARLYKMIALALIALGAIILTVHIGRVPMIALMLVVTFVTYSFLKKTTPLGPLVGITVETLILLPFAVLFLVYRSSVGIPFFFTADANDILLLISTGVFTSVPLLLFSTAVRWIDFSNLGFIQYYAPSLSLLIGVFVFREPFTPVYLVSFSLIWTAILIVVITPILLSRNVDMRRPASPGATVGVSRTPSSDREAAFEEQ
jgi:chloramphenicol-sensitive protein RarD